MTEGAPSAVYRRKSKPVPRTGEERPVPPEMQLAVSSERRGIPLSEREKYYLHISTYGTAREADRLVLPAVPVIVAWIVAHKILALIIVIAALASALVGLSGVLKWKEQQLREGLPLFQIAVGEPLPKDIDDPDSTYTLGVAGAVPDRKVQIKFGKGTVYGYLDPVFREGYADTNGNFMIDVAARDIMNFASRTHTLVGRVIGTGATGNISTYIYAQEERPNMRDLQTPIEPVDVHVPTMTEEVAKAVGWTCPNPVTVAEAAEGFNLGRRYQMRMAFPFLCALPGVPYVPGMWIPPFFMISEL